MEKPNLNLEEKPSKTTKNSISISAFLFSILIFVSVFHFSPSTLFNDTKFWFFISNAIILILAADSGAFSSTKQKQDLYEEFLINSRSRSTSSASLIAESSPNYSKSVTEAAIETEIEKKPEIPPEKEISIDKFVEIGEDAKGSSCNSEKTISVKKGEDAKWSRSNSEKTISVVGDEKEKILQRSETEKILHRSETEKLGLESKLRNKENEFSAMPVEELNRRVEEFIQNFNREIRLQEIRSFDGKLEIEEAY